MSEKETQENGSDGAAHGFEKLRAVRLQKMKGLRAGGMNPYPYRFERTHTVVQCHESEKELSEGATPVALAGRAMSIRGHGKTLFGHIDDPTGRLQIYVRRDDIGEDVYKLFKLVEVGDIIGVKGTLFRTRTDELTVRVESFDVLAKAVRSLQAEIN